jgi:dTDP-4-amino-4,6-dideoxygalactose transaminase
VTVPATREESTHAFHQYTIRYARRDELQTKLEELGVGTAIYYPRPIHQQPAYDHLDVSLPVAEQAAEEVLSVPVHPMLSMDDVETVATRIEQALEQLESTPHHQ